MVRRLSTRFQIALALLVAAYAAAQAPGRPSDTPRPAQAPRPPAASPAPAAPQAHPPGARTIPFHPGENLLYSVSWRLFTAGEARMSIDQVAPAEPGGAPVWRARINAISTGFVSKLYRVDDTMVSTFEHATMCSRSLLKTMHEGRRHREIHINFLPDRKLATVRETDINTGHLVRQAENEIEPCTFDVVSALFYVRTLPLEVGRTFNIHVNDGGKTIPITVEVQAREEVKTDAGTFRTIRVEPKVFGGSLFRRSGRMLIWLTDDDQRLMVQLKARLFVGTITASLQRVERGSKQ